MRTETRGPYSDQKNQSLYNAAPHRIAPSLSSIKRRWAVSLAAAGAISGKCPKNQWPRGEGYRDEPAEGALRRYKTAAARSTRAIRTNIANAHCCRWDSGDEDPRRMIVAILVPAVDGGAVCLRNSCSCLSCLSHSFFRILPRFLFPFNSCKSVLW